MSHLFVPFVIFVLSGLSRGFTRLRFALRFSAAASTHNYDAALSTIVLAAFAGNYTQCGIGC
ncbi:MAG: hypothetical protein ACRC46_03505 [Thermoguttaceae bacterium]